MSHGNQPDARPTVWHLLSNRWNSAITEYALSAARAFEIIGYHSVFTPLEGSPADERARRYNLDTRALPHFGLSSLLGAVQLRRQVKPALVMTYGGPETVLAQLLGSEAKLVRFRGQDADLNDRFFEVKQHFAHRNVDKIITPSAALAAKLAKVLPDKTPTVVPLGCDRNVFHPTGDWMTKPEKPEIVVLGRLDPVKGHETFFKIFSALLKTWPSDRPRPFLQVVGQTANIKSSALRAAAEAAGLVWDTDYMLTTTRLRSIGGLLSRATLGVIPSLGSEIICRVAHEFSLCGTPILVSGVGSLEEALFDGAGASYKGMSEPQIVELMRELILHAWEETVDQRKMRADVARQHYSLDAMANCFKRTLTQEV
jgi:glycosyltransferase involved in cell wall biosynthesis